MIIAPPTQEWPLRPQTSSTKMIRAKMEMEIKGLDTNSIKYGRAKRIYLNLRMRPVWVLIDILSTLTLRRLRSKVSVLILLGTKFQANKLERLRKMRNTQEQLMFLTSRLKWWKEMVIKTFLDQAISRAQPTSRLWITSGLRSIWHHSRWSSLNLPVWQDLRISILLTLKLWPLPWMALLLRGSVTSAF